MREIAEQAADGWLSFLAEGNSLDVLIFSVQSELPQTPTIKLNVYPLIAPDGLSISDQAADPTSRLKALPPYVGLMVNPARSEAIVFNDYAGVGRVYYVELPDAIVVSSRIELIQRVTRAYFAIDETALAQFAAIGWIMGNRTPFRGDRLLDAGGSIEAKRESIENATVRIAVGSPVHRTDNHPRVADVADKLLSVVSDVDVPDDEPVTIGLSGGRDSRLVSCLLSRAGIPFSAYTTNNFNEETEIAKLVAGVVAPSGNLSVRDRPSAKEPGEFEASARWLVMSHEGMYEPAYIGAAKPLESAFLPRGGARPRIGGAGGELGHGHFYAHLSLEVCLAVDESGALNHLARRLGLLRFGSQASARTVRAQLGELAQEACSRGFTGVKVLDWFYLRERLRRWSGLAAIQQSNIAPLASYAFAEVALMQSVEDAHSSALHRKLIAYLYPELEGVPFFKASPSVTPASRKPLLISAQTRNRLLSSEMLKEVYSIGHLKEAFKSLDDGEHTATDEAVIKRAVWLLTVQDYAQERGRDVRRRSFRGLMRTRLGSRQPPAVDVIGSSA